MKIDSATINTGMPIPYGDRMILCITRDDIDVAGFDCVGFASDPRACYSRKSAKVCESAINCDKRA